MATAALLDWMRFHPLRFSLILFGFALVLFSLQAHGYAFASASLSENEFWMQPGTDVRARVDVDISSSQLVPISFSISQVEGITLDGALHGIATTGKFSRQIRIDVAENVTPGTYALQLTLHASLDGQTYSYPFPILVHVSQKERVAYFTSLNSTLSPSIDRIQLSPNNITLHRGEVEYAQVSFRNLGNPTDYAIEFYPAPTGLFASVVTPLHSFVDAGESVQSAIEFRAFDSSPFEVFPVSVYARNRVTQERTFLGSVQVSIERIDHALLSIPFSHVELEQGSELESFLTIQNTEASDLDLVVQSSSALLEVSSTLVHVPARSSVSIPFTIHASSAPGTRTDNVYAFNSSYETAASLTVSTIPAIIASGEVESRSMMVSIENDSGVEWKPISLQLRNVPSSWDAKVTSPSTSLLQGESLMASLELTAPRNQSASFLLLVYSNGVLVKSIPVRSTPNPDSFSQVTGFVSGVGKPVIGLVVLLLAALIVFSADFRKRVRDTLPKPKPIVKEKKIAIEEKKPVEVEEKPTPSTPAAAAPTDPSAAK